MSNLKEQVNKTAEILNDIKSALEDQGVDTTGMTPKDYANAVKGIVNDITIENVGLMPMLIFRYSAERPLTPTGGSWNSETNELFLPDGWYDDIDKQFDVAERQHPLWISSAIFSSTGELYKTWTTPVRISGKDGVNGKQGEPGLPGTVAGLTQFFNTPIFYRGDSTRPPTPIVSYDALENQLSLPSNWELTTVETEDGEVYWQSVVSYNTANNPPATATAPVRITAESSVVKGNKRWYQTNNSPIKPIKGTNLWKEWSEDYNIAPSASKPYLWCYDETIYSAENKTTSPVFLLCTYVKGLLDIDISYTVGSSQKVITKDDYPVNFWFVNSKDALDIHQDLPQHPDDSENKYYPGLNEKTMLLWCKETFNFLDHDESFYRIISYYKAAEKAPVLYSAGVFNTGVRYTRNEEQCPYIFYPAGLYLDKDEMAITVIDKDTGKERPAKDSDAPDGKKYQYFFLKNSYEIGAENNYKSFYDAYVGKRWKKIDSFEAIYSDIGIFNSALVGKFVFDDKYLFSQFGKDGNSGKIGQLYTDYTDIKGKVYDYEQGVEKDRTGVAVAIEDPNATKKFIPATLINAVTGESWFANGNAKFYYDGDGDLADGAVAWRHDNSGKTTLYIDGDVKIGTKAPEHSYGGNVTETGTSLNELIASEASRLNLLANSAELVIKATNNNTYKVFGLPITVSTGDTFTFKAENIERLVGTTNLVAVRILSPDLQTTYSDNTIGFGENKVLTFKITKEGVRNAKAVFPLYAGGVNNTTGNTIRYTNFSLVKGSVPMPMWQDYQGDNGLKNLLTIDSTYNGNFTAHTYYGESLPAMKAGEQYTFCISNISANGTKTQITTVIDNGNGKVITNRCPIYLNKWTQWGTFTITEDCATPRILIENCEGPNTSLTANITGFSLVKGTRPMMVWKGNDDITDLKNTFGSVAEVEGVSLSKAIAVKNSSGSVTGILNGGTEYTACTSKSNDGTPISFASGVNKSTYSTLKDRVSDAKFIVYDTGSLSIGGGGYYNSPTYFKHDGSGRLANGNIKWDTSGNVTFKGIITGSTIKNDEKASVFKIDNSGITVTATDDGAGFSLKDPNGRLGFYVNSDGLHCGTIIAGPMTKMETSYYSEGEILVGSASGIVHISGGKVSAENGFFQTSDKTLKIFSENISIDFDKLKQIPKKYFYWKDRPDKLEIGTSAQEVQKLYPEIVNEDSEGMLSVDYSKLSIIALAAIDKLHEENIELKNRLTKLEELYGNRS